MTAETSMQEVVKRLRENSRDIEAWLALSELVEEEDKKIECLERVLKIAPNHSLARSRLRALRNGEDFATAQTGASNVKEFEVLLVDDHSLPVVNRQIRADCEEGVRYLKENYRVTFDYSVESLISVDKVAEMLSERFQSGDRSQEIVATMIYLSLYFGEVIREHIGGMWVESEDLHNKFETVETKFLMLQKTVIDPFEPIFSLFKGQRIPVVDAFRQVAVQFGKNHLLASLEKASLSKQEVAWICPSCQARNRTAMKLFDTVPLRCPVCGKEYVCATGEVVWAKVHTVRRFFDMWLNWVVRISQEGERVREIPFVLRNPDFGIARGDFVIILFEKKRRGALEVVYVENKTSGNIIMPGR